MKRTLFLILILLLTTRILYAQVYFQNQRINAKPFPIVITTSITLCPEKKYFYIDLDNFGDADDMVNTVFIFKGTYCEKNDTLFLKDDISGFSMKALRKNYQLLMLTGPLNLKMQTFNYMRDYDCSSEFYSRIQLRKERKIFNELPSNPFPVGCYKDARGDFLLRIDDTNNFTFSFYGLTILQGTCKKNYKTDELALFDKSTNHTFYFSIKGETLISNLIDGTDEERVFHKVPCPSKATNALMHPILSQPAPSFEEKLKGFVIEPEEPDEPYIFVEQMPEFNGGEKALMKFLKKNTRYPESAKNANIQGSVIISVVIEKDGSIGDIKIIRGLCESCDEEAIRVIKSMPTWIPGRHHGVNVAVIYTIPIRFRAKE